MEQGAQSKSTKPSSSSAGPPPIPRSNPEVCPADTHASSSTPSSASASNIPCHPMDDSVLNLIDKFHTRKSTKSALNVWCSWQLERLKQTSTSRAAASSSDSQEPNILFFYEVCGYDTEKMDELLAQFVAECKNKEGEWYPPETLRGMIFGLQRFLRAYCMHTDQSPINFVKNEFQFPKYCAALRKKMAELNALGVQTKNNFAVGMTYDEERLLWEEGVLGCTSAEVLSNTVFTYIVKVFGIVSANALRTLTTDTFVFGECEAGKYVELDKDFAGDLEDFGASSCCHNLFLYECTSKKLRHYHDPTNPRTFYNILKFYAEIIKKTKATDNALLLQPLKSMAFSENAIGRNQLQKKFGKMMMNANLSGYFTTQALVQSVLDSLQMKGYTVRRKRPVFSLSQQLQICKILDPPPGTLTYKNFKVLTKQGIKYVKAHEVMELPAPSLTTNTRLGQVHYVLQVGLQQQQQTNIPVAVLRNETLSQNAPQDASSIIFRPVFTGSYIPIKANPGITQGYGLASTTSVTYVYPSVNSSETLHVPAQVTQPELKVEKEKFDLVPGYSTATEKDGDESDGTNDYDFDNVIIKQEPIEYEGEDYQYTREREQINTDNLDIQNSRKRGVSEQAKTEEMKKRKLQESGREYERSECENQTQANSKLNDSDTDGDKNMTKESENQVHDAVIEYCFSNDLEKKVTKQEVSLKEENQAVFSFSGTSKMGRAMGDLDINLGDYLPENCTIKPGDINLKRVITAEGGKLTIKLKYTMNA